MKQFFYKFLCCTMAFVVLCSTMSFTIDIHFCGDTLVDSTLFGKAEGCGMELQQSITEKGCSITKKNCCSDEQKIIKGQDELQLSFDALSIHQQFFTVSYIYSYVYYNEALINSIIPFKEYSPPLVVKNIQLLDEVFLI